MFPPRKDRKKEVGQLKPGSPWYKPKVMGYFQNFIGVINQI